MHKICLHNYRGLIALFLVLYAGLALPARSIAQEKGIDGSIGHTAFSTVGRDTGITYLGLFPYIQNGEEQILFGDIRGFLTNDGNLGANLTTGFRFLEPSNLFVLGANTSFNFDQSSEKTFQQIGFGLEGLTSIGNITTNFYFPVGNDEQLIQRTVSGTRFVGTTIVVDTVDTIGVAMKGLDASLGFYLPGDMARQYQLEATFGWYHFEGNNVAGIDGFKIQFDGKISQSLSAQTAITNDNTFGTNVTLGLDWRFGKGGVPKGALEKQLRRFVQRNYNVVLSKRSITGTAIPLVNPTSGAAYNVQHVGNSVRTAALPYNLNLFDPANLSPTVTVPTGTEDDPWNSIANAQRAGADIIVLESGPSTTESITLTDGQILIGKGTQLEIEDATFGWLKLPEINSGANSAPVLPPQLTIASGNGITLGNNSNISGVTIDSPTGIGILADGVSGFSVSDVTIKNATGNGIEIRNASQGSFARVTVESGGQDGIYISDADNQLDFEEITVSNMLGNGINITGGYGKTVLKGAINLDGNRLSGLRISGLETITRTDDRGTADTADDITTTIIGTVNVENLTVDAPANARGVHLENNDGFISFAKIDITSSGNTALFVNNSGGLLINDGNLTSTNAAAIEIEQTEMDIFLKSVSVDGGPLGIGLKQAKGRLFILGDQLNNTAFSGGTIQNTDVAFRMESSGSLATQLLKLSGNETILESSNSEFYKLSRSLITGTTSQFVNANNLRALEIDTNTFENNTLSSQSGIQYNVAEVGGYSVRLAGNLVKQSPEIFFNTTALPGGELASLNYVVQQNEIQMDKASAMAARLNWIGSVNANIANNLITGSNINQKGIELNTDQSNATSTFLISQNGIGFTAANGVAIDMNLGGPAVANLTGNTIEFAGRDGVGIRVAASKTSRWTLAQNQIDDNAGGATGILFSTLHDGSNVSLEGNDIDLSNFSAFVDRGIIFNTVTGTDNPFITLESNLSNTISGASTTFSVPANSIRGRTIINGQILQQQ